MTKFILPEKTFKENICGDFLFGDERYIGVFDKSMYKKSFIKLQNLDYNPLEVLETLDIDKKFFEQFKYVCPITHMEFYGVIPLIILTENIEKYLLMAKGENYYKHYKDMYLDMDFQRAYWNDKLNINDDILSKIELSMLGTGYKYMPYDGMSSIKYCTIPMDNGDTMVCAAYIWFNN